MALVQHRPSVFDAGPALYTCRCCADVLSLLDYDVITFNEHNKNHAHFYFIMYAYFNLINIIMYRPYSFFLNSYYMPCNNYCIKYFINKKKYKKKKNSAKIMKQYRAIKQFTKKYEKCLLDIH